MGLFKKNKKIAFPFADAPNTATFTCCHVLNKERPILHVSHDEDGYWQFLCGAEHSEEEARIVSLLEILQLDPGVSDLAQMERGCYAESNDENSPWVVRRR